MNKLGVGINANLNPLAVGGIQTNLVQLAKNLLSRPSACDYSFLSSETYKESWRDKEIIKGAVNAWPFAQVQYNPPGSTPKSFIRRGAYRLADTIKPMIRLRNDLYLRKNGLQVIHFPYQVYFYTGLPFIYEPWDLQHIHFPENFSKDEWLWRDRVYKYGCRKAALIIVATAWTKKDIVQRFQISPDKIAVIYRNAGHQHELLSAEQRAKTLQSLGILKEFAFYPATPYPHKNHMRLLKAIHILRDQHNNELPIVFCGGGKKNQWAEIESHAVQLKLENLVHFLGAVEQMQLAALYSEAKFLLFPSLFEGFGYPLLEAMEYGIPIVASRSSCIPEVAGDAAVYFDGEDIHSIVSAVMTTLQSPRLADDLVIKSKQRLSSFSWEQASRAFEASYKFVAEKPLNERERNALEEGIKRT